MRPTRPLVLLTVAVLLPGVTWAQASLVSDSAQARNDCRLAAQVLTTGEPANKHAWAAGVIVRCHEAATALARSLALTVPGSAEETRTIIAAIIVSDRRLLDGIITLLDDGSRPALKQLAALRVAATLINPRTLVEPDRYAIAEWGVLVGQFDNDPIAGPIPITDADRTRALDAISRLSGSASDPLVRRVAHALDRELRLLR